MNLYTVLILLGYVIIVVINLGFYIAFWRRKFGLDITELFISILASVVYSLLGPFSFILTYYLTDELNNGWAIDPRHDDIIERKVKKNDKLLMELMNKYQCRLEFSIFSFLEILDLKDKFSKKYSKWFDNVVVTNSCVIVLNKNKVELRLKEDKFIISKKVDSNFRIVKTNKYVLADSSLKKMLIFPFGGGKYLDTINIMNTKDNINYLEQEGYNYIIHKELIGIENARVISLPQQVRSKKLEL